MKSFTLANGVKVFVISNASGGANYRVSATVRVGHVNEPKLGIAAVCEKVLLSQLESTSAVYGGTITSFLTGCSKENVGKAVESLAAVFKNPDLSQEKIDAAVNDIIQHTRDRAVLPNRQMKLLYKHTAFKKGKVLWDTEAYIASIRSIVPEDLKKLIDTYYSGKNLVIGIAGPLVKGDKFCDLVKAHFEDYPSGTEQKLDKQFYTGGYAKISARTNFQKVMMGWDVSNLQNVAEANVLMSMLFGRLERSFAEAGMNVSTEVKIAGYYGNCRTLRVAVTLNTGESMNDCIDIVCYNIWRLKEKLASDRRMETSRNTAMTDKLFQLTQREDASIEPAWQILGRGQMYDISERINATWQVSARDVQDIAREIFSTPLTMVVCANSPCYTYEEVKKLICKQWSYAPTVHAAHMKK